MGEKKNEKLEKKEDLGSIEKNGLPKKQPTNGIQLPDFVNPPEPPSSSSSDNFKDRKDDV